MSENHVEAYFKALKDKNALEAGKHVADGIVLESPILTDPTVGKEAMLKVMTTLIETVDDLEAKLHLEQGNDHAVFFVVSCDGVQCDGNEHLHTDSAGLIDHINVAWRPLENLVKIQQKLVAHLGGKPKYLVEEPQS